jgi:hypothetical protein
MLLPSSSRSRLFLVLPTSLPMPIPPPPPSRFRRRPIPFRWPEMQPRRALPQPRGPPPPLPSRVGLRRLRRGPLSWSPPQSAPPPLPSGGRRSSRAGRRHTSRDLCHPRSCSPLAVGAPACAAAPFPPGGWSFGRAVRHLSRCIVPGRGAARWAVFVAVPTQPEK